MKKLFALLLLVSLGKNVVGMTAKGWNQLVVKFTDDVLAIKVPPGILKAAKFGLSKEDFKRHEIVLVPRTAGGYSYGTWLAVGNMVSVTEGKSKMIDPKELGKIPGEFQLLTDVISKKRFEELKQQGKVPNAPAGS